MRADVVVVGAGPAGAHAASTLHQQGLTVILVDRRPQGTAGAQWLNGVAGWMFEAAGLSRPVAPELHGGNEPYRMIAPRGATLTVPVTPGLEVDMRLLGERCVAPLLRDAPERVLWETEVQDVEVDSTGRPTALLARRLVGGASRPVRLEAPLFVDASGLGAVVRRRVPKLDRHCPRVAPRDLCTASAELHEIVDREGARRFLDRMEAVPTENLAWVSAHGGYSLLRVTISQDMAHASLLTGSIATPEYPSGQKIMDEFVGREPWLGAVEFGGARAIPIRRPYTHLVSDGIALLGDAACQVFSAHGSGIGVSLIAARLLAETVADARSQGKDLGGRAQLWPYAARFHRDWGGVLGGSDAFRRLSQTLAPEVSNRLIGKMMTQNMVLATLAQKPVSITASELPQLLRAAVGDPAIVMVLLPVLLRMPLINQVASLYPLTDPGHDRSLALYEQVMSRLVEWI